ncbi:major facilitator superfamily permease [Flavobacterium psychrophilum]|nr:major facilitator superfamily permease [Flavobacterium psychrophilum]
MYHHEQFNLTELQTGLLLTLNGLIIFFLEMPFVSYIERNKISKLKVCGWGLLLMTISLSLLMINFWSGILIVMMVFMTFGEMFVFPFSNSFALSRAPKGHEGRYMAIFTMSYSCAHIFSSKAGLDVVSNFGYQKNWFLMTILGIISIFLIIWVIKLVDKENTNLKNS